MVEGIVSTVFARLSTVVENEASLLGGLCDEVNEIKLELDSMRRLLRDADGKKENSEMVKNWVEQVRDVAYDVEDIIDEFLYRLERQQHNGGICNFVRSAIRFPKDVIIRHQIATRLQNIKSRIELISVRRNRYPTILQEETGSLHDGQETGNYLMEISETDGLKLRLDLLVKMLLEDKPNRIFISVVGMGGCGKTTLVDKAYREKIVTDHFKDYRAWIHVSRFFGTEDLLRGMIKELFLAEKEELPANIDSMDDRQLKEKIKDHLQAKRYLIVLDDIWSTDALFRICSAFPSNSCGSRVIVTTRKEDVTSALSDEVYPIHLHPLDMGESLELFRKRVFWNQPCPPDLEHLAGKIVSKCEGLPLAIVAMGGICSSRQKNWAAWKQVLDSLTWHMHNHEMLRSISSILLISYRDLPDYLKPCFLFCSIFPENQLIHRKRLIRLWVAQGFVQERNTMKREDVAEEYLVQLVQRSMIQAVQVNISGRIRACRIHTLMREMALSKCEEERFSMIYTGQEKPSQEGKIRHLAIHISGENSQDHITGMRQLRSFFIFDKNMNFTSSLHAIVSSFKLLRVLDLRHVPIDSLPDELTNLFNLRHLDLRGTNVRVLPKSIGRLRNLLTLNIRDTKIETLPKELARLQKLGHLLVGEYQDCDVLSHVESFRTRKGVLVPINICDLRELISLTGVEANNEFASKVGELNHLRRLGVYNLREVDGEEICKSITKMTSLVHLELVSVNGEEVLKLEALSSPPPELQKLSLYGRLENMPCNWFSSLTSLTHLELCHSQLSGNPLPFLELLPNLLSLVLLMAYNGPLLYRGERFPKLQKLAVYSFSPIRINVPKGVMVNLQEIIAVGSRVSITPGPTCRSVTASAIGDTRRIHHQNEQKKRKMKNVLSIIE